MAPDIVIGDQKLVIECDGWHWHRNSLERDIETNKLLEAAGWLVVRVRQGLVPIGPLDVVVARDASVETIMIALAPTLDGLGLTGLVDPASQVTVTRSAPEDRVAHVALTDSFAFKSPELMAEWDYVLNEADPSRLARYSRYVASWICSKCGCHWQRSLAGRSKTLMCPTCSRSEIDDERTLGFLFPGHAALWSKRNTVSPDQVSATSQNIVWWNCNVCPSEFQTSVHSKVQSSLHCPKCAIIVMSQPRTPRRGKSVAELLSTVKPLWSKSNALAPTAISYGSEKYTLWLCPTCHEEFRARTNAVMRGGGHVTCGRLASARSRGTAKPGRSLAEMHPNALSQWSRQNDRSALSINPGSGYIAVWECTEGHSHRRRVVDHRNRDFVCPKCFDRRRREPYRSTSTQSAQKI